MFFAHLSATGYAAPRGWDSLWSGVTNMSPRRRWGERSPWSFEAKRPAVRQFGWPNLREKPPFSLSIPDLAKNLAVQTFLLIAERLRSIRTSSKRRLAGR